MCCKHNALYNDLKTSSRKSICLVMTEIRHLATTDTLLQQREPEIQETSFSFSFTENKKS